MRAATLFGMRGFVLLEDDLLGWLAELQAAYGEGAAHGGNHWVYFWCQDGDVFGTVWD